MNNYPLYSVLIANYNNSIFFDDLFSSLRNQTYKNLEIIFVDDFSTDNSVELAYKFQKLDSRIKIFQNEINKGVAFTKDKCIKLSKGEYFGFVDPDDFLEPNAIFIMVNKHLENKNIGLIYSNFYLRDEILSKKIKPNNYPKDLDCSKYLLYGFSPNHFASFRRNLYENTIGIDLTLKRAIDRDLVLKYEELSSVVHIDDYLYNYRINSNCVSNNQNSYKAEYWAWIVRFNALKRRNLSCEDFYSEYRIYFDSKICDYSKTKDFKIGNIVLMPLRWVKKLFNNCNFFL
ncbi:MAG: glycosyltransferase [Bacteroidales bacterium]|nr:glycosyltransferase [Bacteroidales bacterium]